MDLLQCLMDSSSHAIFTLDRDGIITHINQQAKVRFGLYHNSQHPHPAGRLEPGDLVLIADTAIGADDGALRPEDLARIGIREPRLRVNDRLVAAGVFDMPGRRPVYKFLPDQDADSLCLETVCEGIPIRLSIERRSVTVTVRDTVYTIGYFRCIGQMVVLDGATGRVKFWQEKGYSARREGIGHLLRGGSYSEKRAGLSLQVDCGILITGENGTGKSFLAQAIRQAQPRRGPFVTVDCATISPTLFESEMFGYVGGAFTGANPQGKAGFFESADGGTIFLDEIGEIPLQIQAKLLSVIQNKVVCRVGSTRSVPVDVRILAATNRDLRAEVAAGRFRQDLYYRLSAFSVELPPLRSCPEDVCFLIDRLMEKIPQKYGVPPRSLSGEAFGKLLAYNWPGNIRELENVLENAVALSESELIYAEHIHLEGTAPAPLTLKERLKREERQILRQTLAQCGGSRVKAMELLGLSKTVFYGKLKEYQLD